MAADAECCLNVAGSINSPYCKVLQQREVMMGKGKKNKKHTKNQTPCAGKSILEMYWDELDTIVDRLMNPDDEAADGLDKGRADTAAYFIAILDNPYHPDAERVRDEAMVRFEARDEENDPYRPTLPDNVPDEQ